MSTQTQSLIYSTAGGLLTLHELRLLAEAALSRGDGRLRITERQEILLREIPLPRARRLLAQPDAARLGVWSPDRPRGIVTTMSAVGLPGTREWLTAGLLNDAVFSLVATPGVTLSLSDPVQGFVPALSSQINFLASAQRDLWHVHVCGATLPGAVRMQDLGEASRNIEATFTRGGGLPAVLSALKPLLIEMAPLILPTVESYATPLDALIVPALHGGISARYMVELCLLLMDVPGALISVTPWRELCVRGLAPALLRRVELQMLRWRVPAFAPWRRVLCGPELRPLAKRLRCALAAACPGDAGIAWALTTHDEPLPEAHVAVRAERVSVWRRKRYTVLARAGCAARVGEWREIAAGIGEGDLVGAILESLSESAKPAVITKPVNVTTSRINTDQYACRDCLTEYSAEFGDPTAQVAPGTRFDALPSDWRCSVCGAEKERYANAV